MSMEHARLLDSGRALFTAEETAAILGVGRSKVFELARTNRLASVKIDTSRRFRRADIEAFMAALGVDA